MLIVKFSCKVCGLTNHRCEVRGRRSDEPLMNWTENVLLKGLAEAHIRASLLCRSNQLSNILVPHSDENKESQWFGQEPDEWQPKVK